MSVCNNLSEIYPSVTDDNYTYGDEYCIIYKLVFTVLYTRN